MRRFNSAWFFIVLVFCFLTLSSGTVEAAPADNPAELESFLDAEDASARVSAGGRSPRRISPHLPS